MTENIVPFTGLTKADLDAATILNAIAEEKPDHVLVFSIKDDEIAYHSSTSDPYKLLYYVESFKNYLMNGGFDDER